MRSEDRSLTVQRYPRIAAMPNSPVPVSSVGSQLVTAAQAPFVDLGSLGVRFLARAADTRGTIAIVEHPLPPLGLAAPLHRHTREDEYSYVLEGTMGAQLGAQVIVAQAGSLIFKPRGQWHTFWNAGAGSCRVLEIIAPGGFEAMFEEIAADPDALTGDAAAALDARYGLDVDYDSIEQLCRDHGLTFNA